MMSPLGQARRFSDVRNASAYPLPADMILQRHERRKEPEAGSAQNSIRSYQTKSVVARPHRQDSGQSWLGSP
jgi:hypothetical protein